MFASFVLFGRNKRVCTTDLPYRHTVSANLSVRETAAALKESVRCLRDFCWLADLSIGGLYVRPRCLQSERGLLRYKGRLPDITVAP